MSVLAASVEEGKNNVLVKVTTLEGKEVLVVLKLDQVLASITEDTTIDVPNDPKLAHKPSKRRKSGKESKDLVVLFINKHGTPTERIWKDLIENKAFKELIQGHLSKEIVTAHEFDVEAWWRDNPHKTIFLLFHHHLDLKAYLHYSRNKNFVNGDTSTYTFEGMEVDQALSVVWKGDYIKKFAAMGCTACDDIAVGNIFPIFIAECKRWKSKNTVSGKVYDREVTVEPVLNETVLYSYVLLQWISSKLPEVAKEAIIVGYTQVGFQLIISWSTIIDAKLKQFKTDIVFKGAVKFDTDDKVLWQLQSVIEESHKKSSVFVNALVKLDAITQLKQ